MYYLAFQYPDGKTEKFRIYSFESFNLTEKDYRAYTICKERKTRSRHIKVPVNPKRITGVIEGALVSSGPSEADIIKIMKWLERGIMESSHPTSLVSEQDAIRMLSQ